MKDIILTTVRLPRVLWVKLRRLQEEGKIKNIHQAILKGLEWIVNDNLKK